MPVSYDLGTAYGKVVIDYDGKGVTAASAGVRGLDADAQRLVRNSSSVGPALRQVGNSALLVGTAIVGGFGLAVKAATDFEFQLGAIQAVSGATASEMDQIAAAARRIGADTKYNSVQAAQAFEELIKAGISVEDALNGAAAGAAAIAAAGGIGIPEAAQIASAALNQFKLSASDLTDVADILAGAANASATGVSEIGQALTFVGPVANAAGLSLKDTATAIALFANNGIDGMRAGTALRAMLSSLSSPTDQAADQMKALGLITADGANQFFDATGKIKPFNEIAGLLRDTLGDLTSEQLLQFADAVVGRENMSSLSAIVNTSSEQFDKLATSIDSVSAADVAAARMNNLSGQLEQTKGNLQDLGIEIGTILIPRLMELTEGLIAGFQWFTNLDDGVQNVIVNFALFTGGMLLAVGVLAHMASSMIALRDAMVALKIVEGITQGLNNFRAGLASSAAAASIFTGTMGTLAGALTIAAGAVQRFTLALIRNPLTLIIVAVAALVAAMILLYQNSAKVRATFEPLMQTLQAAGEKLAPVFQQIGEAVMEFVDAILSALMPVIQQLVEALAPLLTLLLNALMPIVSLVADILLALLGPALQVVGKLIEALAPIILLLLKAITPLIDLLTMILVPILDGLAWVLGVVADALQVAADWVDQFFATSSDGTSQASDAWDAFMVIVNDVIANIISFFQPMIDLIVAGWNNLMAVLNFVGEAWNNIMAVVGAVVTWFQTYVSPLIEAFVGLIVALFEFGLRNIAFAWNLIQTAIGIVVDWFNTYVGPVINTVVTFIVGLFQTLAGFVSSIWNAIAGFIGGAVTTAANWINTTFAPLISWFHSWFDPIAAVVKTALDLAFNNIKKIKDDVIGFFSGAAKWLVDAGKWIIDGLIKGIEGALGGLTDLLNNITNMIPKNKGPKQVDLKLLEENGGWIMQGLMSGLRSEIPALRNLLGDITVGMPDSMNANIAAALAGTGGSSSREFNYYAAPGTAQLDGEDELFVAMKRSRVVVPGW